MASMTAAVVAVAIAGCVISVGCRASKASGRQETPARGRVIDRQIAGESGWLALFDGRTLDGWVQRGGRAEFRVEKGELVGATRPDEPNSFLCTRVTFTDFELDLEFRIDPELNSGIQIRSESRPEDGRERVFGYQVEIDPSERAWTGGLYDEGRRGWLAPLADNAEASGAFVQNEWNHLRVEARGDLIRTWINGVPAVEVRDAMTRSGFIALQVHGVGARRDELTVRWREIRLRELTGPDGGATGSPVIPRKQASKAGR